MIKGYQSVKPKVLALLERELPTLREKYGVETIGIFGSVSREEDTPRSDVDIVYSFHPEMDTYENLLDLGDFLEDLLQRRVDLVSVEWMSERFRTCVMMEAIFCTRERDAA
ncbi:nucleotidyltransferase domain-containing protein [Methanoculleus sp.]|uniref:nucleotidyltransferase family protein n=1 Tax=Methanoculleus sp. TaxID=90427 RepID=UPI0025CF37A4|nr:nucleotidyltransferase domain-containing protein [Methanoculleus sp.]